MESGEFATGEETETVVGCGRRVQLCDAVRDIAIVCITVSCPFGIGCDWRLIDEAAQNDDGECDLVRRAARAGDSEWRATFTQPLMRLLTGSPDALTSGDAPIVPSLAPFSRLVVVAEPHGPVEPAVRVRVRALSRAERRVANENRSQFLHGLLDGRQIIYASGTVAPAYLRKK